jgi:hypothetical protein
MRLQLMRPRGETVSTHPEAAGDAEVAKKRGSRMIPGRRFDR